MPREHERNDAAQQHLGPSPPGEKPWLRGRAAGETCRLLVDAAFLDVVHRGPEVREGSLPSTGLQEVLAESDSRGSRDRSASLQGFARREVVLPAQATPAGGTAPPLPTENLRFDGEAARIVHRILRAVSFRP